MAKLPTFGLKRTKSRIEKLTNKETKNREEARAEIERLRKIVDSYDEIVTQYETKGSESVLGLIDLERREKAVVLLSEATKSERNPHMAFVYAQHAEKALNGHYDTLELGKMSEEAVRLRQTYDTWIKRNGKALAWGITGLVVGAGAGIATWEYFEHHHKGSSYDCPPVCVVPGNKTDNTTVVPTPVIPTNNTNTTPLGPKVPDVNGYETNSTVLGKFYNNLYNTSAPLAKIFAKDKGNWMTGVNGDMSDGEIISVQFMNDYAIITAKNPDGKAFEYTTSHYTGQEQLVKDALQKARV